MCNSHSLSTASGRSFNHNGKTYFICYFQSFFHIGYGSVTSRNYRYTKLFHSIFCLRFITEKFYMLCRRTYKFETAFFTNFCKFGVFSQKTIARMNSINICNFCGSNNIFYFKVAVSCQM